MKCSNLYCYDDVEHSNRDPLLAGNVWNRMFQRCANWKLLLIQQFEFLKSLN